MLDVLDDGRWFRILTVVDEFTHACLAIEVGRLPDECLNEHWFASFGHARQLIESWRLDYNAIRPRTALGDIPPEEFEQITLNRATAPVLSS